MFLPVSRSSCGHLVSLFPRRVFLVEGQLEVISLFPLFQDDAVIALSRFSYNTFPLLPLSFVTLTTARIKMQNDYR